MKFKRYKIIIWVLLFPTNIYSNIDQGFLDEVSKTVNRNPDFLIKKSEQKLNYNAYHDFYKSVLPSLKAGIKQTNENTLSTKKDQIDGFVRADLNLFSGFKDVSRYKILKRRHDSTMKELEVLRTGLGHKFGLLLIDYINKYKTYLIQEKFLKIKKDSMLISKLSFKRGAISKQEFSKSLIDYQNSIALFQSSKMDFEQNKREVLEVAPEFVTIEKWPFLKLSINLTKEILDKKVLGLSDSDEFKLLKIKKEEFNQNIVSAYSSYYPKMDLSFKYSKDFNTGTYRDEKLTILSLTFPLFNQGRDEHVIRESRYKLYTVDQNIVKLTDKIASGSQIKKMNLWRSLVTLRMREETLDLSRALYKDNFKRFKNGRVHINDFHVDQNRLLQSEKLYNQGLYLFHQQAINYCSFFSLSLEKCFSIKK